jgi:hypothetical protein
MGFSLACLWLYVTQCSSPTLEMRKTVAQVTLDLPQGTDHRATSLTGRPNEVPGTMRRGANSLTQKQ